MLEVLGDTRDHVCLMLFWANIYVVFGRTHIHMGVWFSYTKRVLFAHGRFDMCWRASESTGFNDKHISGIGQRHPQNIIEMHNK